jgi:anti-sigma B factor antagonist
MKARIITTDRGSILHLSGSADYKATSELSLALSDAVKSCSGRVICDISRLTFICSDALGAFISARQQAQSVGGYMRLVSPQHRVAEIIETTRLNQVFAIFDCVDHALDAQD